MKQESLPAPISGRPIHGLGEQVRRNHSVPCCTHPDFPLNGSRKEATEKHESYMNMLDGEGQRFNNISINLIGYFVIIDR